MKSFWQRILMVLGVFYILGGAFFVERVQALAVPPTSVEFYVQDLADLVSASAEAEWIREAKSLDESTGAQVVLLTLPSLEDEALEDFSVEVARAWGVGDGQDNTGVLVLLVKDSHDIRIEIGYGLEGALPDGATGRLMREYLIPKLQENDYDGGVLATEKAIAEAVRGELDLSETESEYDANEGFSLIFGAGIFAIVVFFWCASERNWWRKCPKCGKRKWTKKIDYLSGLKQQVVTTCQNCHYQKKGPIMKITSESNTFGGGFGSGSSGGSSSGGSSGGGGSFGGGGASGKW